MELRRLRLLAELSRSGTIARVAEVLGYSPSSVSVQLSELEREAGTKLLTRVGRNVQLTPAGRRLASYADQALAADEGVRSELSALAVGAPTGTVKISSVQTVAMALLPNVLAQLAHTAPDLRLEIEESATRAALEDLHSRRLDLVVGIDYEPTPPPRFPGIDHVPLLTEDVLLAVPSRSRFARRTSVDIADLAAEAWAAGPAGEGHRAVIDHLCNRIGGFSPDVRHHTDDTLVLRALVSSGHAVTLLPALIGKATPHVALRQMDGVSLRRTIFTATRHSSGQSSAIAAVLTALGDAARVVTSGRTDARPA